MLFVPLSYSNTTGHVHGITTTCSTTCSTTCTTTTGIRQDLQFLFQACPERMERFEHLFAVFTDSDVHDDDDRSARTRRGRRRRRRQAPPVVSLEVFMTIVKYLELNDPTLLNEMSYAALLGGGVTPSGGGGGRTWSC